MSDVDFFKWSARPISDNTYLLDDHLGGFDEDFRNRVLDHFAPGSTCYTEYILPDQVKKRYPHLNLKFSAYLALHGNHVYIVGREASRIAVPKKQFKNFLCSFNRADQIGRHWLVAALNHRGWFNPEYSSKHFALNQHSIRAHNIVPHINIKDLNFYEQLIQHDWNGDSRAHKEHMWTLAPKIQDNFMTLVAETFAAETTVPFWTEKFMYPIANKTLWAAFAAPGYHKFVETYLGFKPYKCFDYSFDKIENHADRLHALLEMLEPFSKMTVDEWQNIYQTEQHTIEYNHQWLCNHNAFAHLTMFDEFDFPIESNHDWVQKFGSPYELATYTHYQFIKYSISSN